VTEPEAPADVYAADGYFAVIPEWVLDSGISSRAVHLYALLRRYADQRTGMAHPSRKTLAGRLGVSDEKTVDRATEELVAVGAIRVRPRYGNGQRARVQDGPSPDFPQRGANAYFLLAQRHPRNHYADGDAQMRDEAGVDDAQMRDGEVGAGTTQSENGGGGGADAPTHRGPRGADQHKPAGGEAATPPPPDGNNGEGWGHPTEEVGAPVGEEPKPLSTSKNSSSPTARESTLRYRESFAIFWAAYPRKVGKIAAEKAFAKAARAAGNPEAVLAGLARATFAADPQYVPHPATWLNQGRWADEPDPAPPLAKESRPWENTSAAPALARETKPWEQ
jgi:hypothetical protein